MSRRVGRNSTTYRAEYCPNLYYLNIGVVKILNISWGGGGNTKEYKAKIHTFLLEVKATPQTLQFYRTMYLYHVKKTLVKHIKKTQKFTVT